MLQENPNIFSKSVDTFWQEMFNFGLGCSSSSIDSLKNEPMIKVAAYFFNSINKNTFITFIKTKHLYKMKKEMRVGHVIGFLLNKSVMKMSNM